MRRRTSPIWSSMLTAYTTSATILAEPRTVQLWRCTKDNPRLSFTQTSTSVCLTSTHPNHPLALALHLYSQCGPIPPKGEAGKWTGSAMGIGKSRVLPCEELDHGGLLLAGQAGGGTGGQVEGSVGGWVGTRDSGLSVRLLSSDARRGRAFHFPGRPSLLFCAGWERGNRGRGPPEGERGRAALQQPPP